jgi:hypothetical protein
VSRRGQAEWDEVADELYGLTPDGFTEARDARAREWSAAGRKQEAAEIRKLARPSQAAWLANLLVREQPAEIDQLLALRTKFRQAHDQGTSGDLRVLSQRRQDVVARLVSSARGALRRDGRTLGPDIQRQLEATLEAAVADDAAATALRRGRLTRALSHIGFGDAVSAGPDVACRRRGARAGEQVDKATRERDSARVALRNAAAALKEARRRQQEAERRRRDAAGALRQAERDLARASVQYERAATVHEQAAEAVKPSRPRAGRARRR